MSASTPRAALEYDDLIASQRLLSDEMGFIWRDCSTVTAISSEYPLHHPMPAWINPYDARIIEDEETLKRWRQQGKKPTTMYQQRINVVALRILGKTWDDMKSPNDWRVFREAKEQAVSQISDDLRVFLTGFMDSQGNYWCGHCYSRCQFIDMGYTLDYPALWMAKTLQGYDAWLQTARYSGLVNIEDGLRQLKKMKIERTVRQESAHEA